MDKVSECTKVSRDKLTSYCCDPLPDDHPWPKRENLTISGCSALLGGEQTAFSIGHLKPGQSVEHHRHAQAEEIHVLMRGRAQIRIGDRVLEAEARDAIRVPPEVH